MTPGNEDMSSREEAVIARAEKLLKEEGITEEEIFAGYRELLDEYEKLNRIQKKLIHFSDRQQEKMLVMNINLNEANSSLRDMNTMLSRAQNQIARDMVLARNIQRTFFAHEKTSFKSWKSSFYFKPAGDVSGDFFDIYSSGDTLLGVSLFDVSGHGLSSGLLTLLAKSLVARQFMESDHRPLTEVMENINRELIEEIGSVNNFITGIVVRFEKESIRYVNAAHPPLVIHRNDLSTIELIKPAEKGFNGTILGVPDLEGQYEEMIVPVKKGDVICLFSDGLIEQSNDNGETYGLEGLSSSLEDSKGLAPDKIIKTIIKDHKHFTGGQPLSDDVTILVLLKQ